MIQETSCIATHTDLSNVFVLAHSIDKLFSLLPCRVCQPVPIVSTTIDYLWSRALSEDKRKLGSSCGYMQSCCNITLYQSLFDLARSFYC